MAMPDTSIADLLNKRSMSNSAQPNEKHKKPTPNTRLGNPV